MFRLHEGWDYTVYKIYVFGGIAALIGIPIALALVLQDSFPAETFLNTLMAFLTTWVGGILAYWWWVFLFKEARALRLEAASAADTVPPIRALKNLATLHQAMVLHGGDAEALITASLRARRPILEFYGYQNLLVIWILGLGWASMQDLLPQHLLWLLPVGVLLIALILVLRLTSLVSQSAEGFAAAYLAPLGLELAETPAIKVQPFAFLSGGQVAIPTGAAVLEGKRRNHRIRIETFDEHSRTSILSPAPEFTLRSLDGKIAGVEAIPAAIQKAIKSLRKARRWQGIRVIGGSQGISVERKSRSQNMWLYDLWLVEYLLEQTTNTKED
jgi:hypothetical protein